MPSLALQPLYEESKHPHRYTKLSESCKQVKIINQDHILGQKQVDKSGKYIHIFTRRTIRNQHDILKTSVADVHVSKGQTCMSHKGELQTLTKLSMRHQVCRSETCRMIISESIITMLNHVRGQK